MTAGVLMFRLGIRQPTRCFGSHRIPDPEESIVGGGCVARVHQEDDYRGRGVDCRCRGGTRLQHRFADTSS
jgi:hypothetical protein